MRTEGEKISRRTFLKTAARFTVFSGLLAAGFYLFKRKTVLTRDGEQCINNYLCRGCRVLAGCYLPQAQSFKAITGRSRA